MDVGHLVNLRRFVEEHSIVGLCSVERGGALTHKHFQIMVVKRNSTSLPMFKKKFKACLGWDESPPMGHVVSCKTLRNEGLHIFRDIIMHCMKDNGEKHFEFVHVLAKDMNDGTVEYKINELQII